MEKKSVDEWLNIFIKPVIINKDIPNLVICTELFLSYFWQKSIGPNAFVVAKKNENIILLLSLIYKQRIGNYDLIWLQIMEEDNNHYVCSAEIAMKCKYWNFRYAYTLNKNIFKFVDSSGNSEN